MGCDLLRKILAGRRPPIAFDWLVTLMNVGCAADCEEVATGEPAPAAHGQSAASTSSVVVAAAVDVQQSEPESGGRKGTPPRPVGEWEIGQSEGGNFPRTRREAADEVVVCCSASVSDSQRGRTDGRGVSVCVRTLTARAALYIRSGRTGAQSATTLSRSVWGARASMAQSAARHGAGPARRRDEPLLPPPRSGPERGELSPADVLRYCSRINRLRPLILLPSSSSNAARRRRRPHSMATPPSHSPAESPFSLNVPLLHAFPPKCSSSASAACRAPLQWFSHCERNNGRRAGDRRGSKAHDIAVGKSGGGASAATIEHSSNAAAKMSACLTVARVHCSHADTRYLISEDELESTAAV